MYKIHFNVLQFFSSTVFPCFCFSFDSFKLSLSYYDQLISSNHDLTLGEQALLIPGTHSYIWIKKDAVRVRGNCFAKTHDTGVSAGTGTQHTYH